MLIFFEWLVYIVIVWLCVSSIYSFRSGRAFLLTSNPNPTLPLISKIVLVIAVIFLFTSWSKFHLIWIFIAVAGIVGRIWPKKYQG